MEFIFHLWCEEKVIIHLHYFCQFYFDYYTSKNHKCTLFPPAEAHTGKKGCHESPPPVGIWHDTGILQEKFGTKIEISETRISENILIQCLKAKTRVTTLSNEWWQLNWEECNIYFEIKLVISKSNVSLMWKHKNDFRWKLHVTESNYL